MVEDCRRLGGGKGARGSTDGGNGKITTLSMLSTGRSMAALNRWRTAGGKGKNRPRKMSGAAPRLSCDSQQPDTHNEITYVPTSALKSAMEVDQKNGSGRGTLEKDKCNTENDEDEKVVIRNLLVLSMTISYDILRYKSRDIILWFLIFPKYSYQIFK